MKLSLTNRALADLENINAYLTPVENVVQSKNDFG